MNLFDHLQFSAPKTAGALTQCAAMSNQTDVHARSAPTARAISLESLTLATGADDADSQVRGLSLACAAPDVLRVRGLTDAGRHAFLRVLSGAAEPAQGRYRLAGMDLGSLTPPQRLAARLRFAGSSLRSSRLFPHLTAQENVALSRLVNDFSSADAMAHALVELDRLGAAHAARRRPSTLSIEEHRLTSLAKALAHRPALLLCEFPEEGMGRTAISNLRARLWQAAHDDETCIVLFTENPALADLASTTLHFR